MGISESGAVCPRPSGPGTEQRNSIVYTNGKDWQHWQMGNVTALECAVDQINILHTEGEIHFLFVIRGNLLFYQGTVTAES